MSAPDLPGLPRDEAGAPVFPGVWQARSFALAVHLNGKGVLAWPVFAAALGAELKREDDYWHAWLHALERILASREVAAPETVDRVADLWRRAAVRTPHGTPIRLENAG